MQYYFDVIYAGSINYLLQMPFFEALSTIFGFIYIYLAIKENVCCWIFGAASSFIALIIFWQGFLYMDSLLNIFYVVIAIYGYISWQYPDCLTKIFSGRIRLKNRSTPRKITSLSIVNNLIIIFVITFISISIGWFLSKYTKANYPYLDSLISCFAVIATVMATYKVIENWLYWVIIDSASIYLYGLKGYYFFVLLMIVYTLLAVVGYINWIKHKRLQI